MSDKLNLSKEELLVVPEVTETMFHSARRVIAKHARSKEELEEFISMVAPAEQWRCGYCEKWYPIPSLARSCEANHERTNK